MRDFQVRRISNSGGFTLIEVMIVVVIVAVIAAVAIPSYQDYVTKSRRAAAKSTLLTMAGKQENYFSDLKRYTGDATDLGYPSDPFWLDSDGNTYSSTGANRTYQVSLTQPGGDIYSYTITATATQRQADDSECASFTVNHQGTRTPGSGSDCW